MGTHTFLLALLGGSALLALWCHVRWPKAAPASLVGALLRVAGGLVLLQIGIAALGAAAEASPTLAFAAVLGVIVPVLTFALLAALWIMKVFAESLKGSI